MRREVIRSMCNQYCDSASDHLLKNTIVSFETICEPVYPCHLRQNTLGVVFAWAGYAMMCSFLKIITDNHVCSV